jgi:hypothetical protein
MRGVKLLFSIAATCYYEAAYFPDMSEADRKYLTGTLPERWFERGRGPSKLPVRWMVCFDAERRKKAEEYNKRNTDDPESSTGQDELKETQSSRPAWLCKNKKKKNASKNRKH